jgi:hypothetical protein
MPRRKVSGRAIPSRGRMPWRSSPFAQLAGRDSAPPGRQSGSPHTTVPPSVPASGSATRAPRPGRVTDCRAIRSCRYETVCDRRQWKDGLGDCGSRPHARPRGHGIRPIAPKNPPRRLADGGQGRSTFPGEHCGCTPRPRRGPVSDRPASAGRAAPEHAAHRLRGRHGGGDDRQRRRSTRHCFCCRALPGEGLLLCLLSVAYHAPRTRSPRDGAARAGERPGMDDCPAASLDEIA